VGVQGVEITLTCSEAVFADVLHADITNKRISGTLMIRNFIQLSFPKPVL